ncbi:peptide ABC transporter [Corynebacterium phocae]|uniref:Peptide ABC transporter n=1 Tax=Corynebacterium phocae TaxID=161895 RepID=A0A1L7D0C2_9CORY|nr:hypothetical protein [Corynebacterium phocae]APT91596.1 peptide ABC transporter [Corynebacterium phocae]KAA8720665.1 hypothetical protein F4V58_11950 [Corynebacterium phocae]
MALERLTVKLHDGAVFYFNAGAALGDPSSRLDLLRDAVDTDSLFRSPDINGNMRQFLGSEVSNYHLD